MYLTSQVWAPKGRITQEDVQKYIKGKNAKSMGSGGGAGLDLLPDPKVDFAQFGEVEIVGQELIKMVQYCIETGEDTAYNFI